MAPGGYFGRALVVDAGTGDASVLPLPEEVLRGYLGGAGLGTWLMHRLAPPGVGPAGRAGTAGVRVLPARRHPADHQCQVRRGRQVPAHRNAQRRPVVQPLRHLRQAHRPRRDRGARCVRPAVGAAGRRRRRAAGGRRGPVGAARRRGRGAGCGSGWAVAGGSPRSGRPGSAASATRRSPTTGGTPGAAGWARCSAPSGSRRSPCAPPPRSRRPTRTAVLAAARDLRARSFGPATAKYRELGTLANLLAFNAISTLPTRNFQAATFAGAPQLAAEELAELRTRRAQQLRVLHHRLRAHLLRPAAARRCGWSTRTCSRSARCAGCRTPTRCSPPAACVTSSGLDTISAGGTIAWAMECAERGLIDAPWLRFGDGGALIRALDEIGARDGPRRPARRGLAAGGAAGRRRLGGVRAARQGPGTARLRAAHACRPWRSAWR